MYLIIIFFETFYTCEHNFKYLPLTCIPRKLQRLLLLTRLKKASQTAGKAIRSRDRFGSIRVSSLVSRGIVLFVDLEQAGATRSERSVARERLKDLTRVLFN